MHFTKNAFDLCTPNPRERKWGVLLMNNNSIWSVGSIPWPVCMGCPSIWSWFHGVHHLNCLEWGLFHLKSWGRGGMENFADPPPPPHIFLFFRRPPPHIFYFFRQPTPPTYFDFFADPPSHFLSHSAPQDFQWNSPETLRRSSTQKSTQTEGTLFTHETHPVVLDYCTYSTHGTDQNILGPLLFY